MKTRATLSSTGWSVCSGSYANGRDDIMTSEASSMNTTRLKEAIDRHRRRLMAMDRVEGVGGSTPTDDPARRCIVLHVGVIDAPPELPRALDGHPAHRASIGDRQENGKQDQGQEDREETTFTRTMSSPGLGAALSPRSAVRAVVI